MFLEFLLPSASCAEEGHKLMCVMAEELHEHSQTIFRIRRLSRQIGQDVSQFRKRSAFVTSQELNIQVSAQVS